MIRFTSRFFALFTLCSVLLVGCAPTQEAAETPDRDTADDRPSIRVADYDVEALEYPELREFELPQIERVQLDNGMTIFLVEDSELPLINARARINAGSVHEPAEKVGLASVTGSVMRTGGTATRSPDEVNDALEAIGASVETSIGQTSGSASMSVLNENIDEVLGIFAEVLREPAFDEEEVGLAKSQRRSAISRRNDNPQQVASREFSKIIYGADSPYARTTEYYTIDAIERDDLIAYHEQFVHPENMLLSVWGDFDRQEMIEKLEEAFGDWESPAGADVPTTPQPDTDREYGVHFINKDDVTQSTIYIGHGGELTRDDPDYFPVIVMNEVLSGGFSGRLFREVRSAQGLAYSVFGSYSAGYDRPGQFNAGVLTRSDATIEAARAVLDEIEGMQEEPPSEEELQLAKDAYLNSFVFNFENKGQILGRMMTYEHYEYPEDFLDQIQEGVQRVTAEDVHRVAQEYLYPSEVDILILGRQEDFDEPVSVLAGDAEVNEIDISIPTSPPGEVADDEPATEEELAAGRDRLMQAREALGGAAFDDIASFRQTMETTISTPQGEQSLSSTTLMTIDPERVRMEMTLPNGMRIVLADDGDEMLAETPQGVQPAPPQLREMVRGELRSNMLYVMMNPDRAEVQDRGEQEVEGETYYALEVQREGGSYTMYLDQSTFRPLRLELQETDPMTGSPVEAMVMLEDYSEFNGIQLPTSVTSYQNGEEAAVARVTELELNVDPDDEEFTLNN